MESNELISRARAIACEALASEVRGDGSPFIGHPDAVVQIVKEEIGLSAECLAAVYLHEATRQHPSLDISEFPSDVLTMVAGLNKISTIKPKDTRLEAENYKKLIVQYSSDPRVTVIKIADRLEVMRSLALFPKSSRDQKQLETLMLYIPLAHQLGLYNIKRELEDIYFKYADPQSYRSITNKLLSTAADREQLRTEFVEPLKAKLDAAGISFKLKVRTKTAYSIYKKMQAQKVPFEGVYDVYAMRFIIDCPPDREVEQDLCWKVYSYVTEEYEPDTNRLRDWITNPKPNGYESLHITVKNAHGASVEVQIRTTRMDQTAESGLASHWSYKGIKSEETLTTWLNSVRYALEHPSDVTTDLPQTPTGDIFVFTPSGELRILHSGATVLDFAFGIHSNIGAHCTGAKIGGKVVSIREKLSTGDVVEIITSKNQKPSADWLNWVTTSKAKTRINHELDAELRSQAANGREILERRLKNWKLEFPVSMQDDLMRRLKYPGRLDMMAAIANGGLDVNTVKEFILEQEAVAEGSVASGGGGGSTGSSTLKTFTGAASSDDILVLSAKNVKGLSYKMSRCCNPVFGDDVFGFVTRSEGITIHRMSCPNAARLIERYPYRIQKVVWQESSSTGEFLAGIQVTAGSDAGVMPALMDVVAQFKASLRSCTVTRNARTSDDEISLKILVPSNSELDKVISQMARVRNVLKVKRL